MPSSTWRNTTRGARWVLIRAAAIVAVGAALGLIANTFHPMGLPLVLGDIEGPGIPRWVWERVPNLTPEEAHRFWQADNAIFVDARDSDDFADEHIPGAVNVPFRELSQYYPQVCDRLPRDARIIIYCYGSHCGLAMRLAKRMLPDGYRDLIVMRGGIAGWEAAGLELTDGEKGALDG